MSRIPTLFKTHAHSLTQWRLETIIESNLKVKIMQGKVIVGCKTIIVGNVYCHVGMSSNATFEIMTNPTLGNNDTIIYKIQTTALTQLMKRNPRYTYKKASIY